VAEITVAGVFDALDRIAPFALAAEWDNVGLLAGSREWRARRVLLAIDLTDAVAREALRGRFDAVIAYHPPIFKGVRTITNLAESPTGLLPDLLAARISIFSMHTALDAAVGGTNDVLLDAFDLSVRAPLEPMIAIGRDCKLVVFVPHAEAERLRAALSAAGAGVIGHYSECSFELRGRGSFCGDETTNPTIGRSRRLEYADETRLEMVVPRRRVGAVVRALYATHSYEEPAFDLYPVEGVAARGAVGVGRVGVLRNPMRGVKLADALEGRVDLSCATVIGDLRRTFRSVTAAAGSFGTKAFRDADSLVLTGELKHHDALELQRRGIAAICLGHYASERPVLDSIAARLRKMLRGVTAKIARSDRSPLVPLPVRNARR
jgi:dinuclear metal center YbgI/SA1388 family protein